MYQQEGHVDQRAPSRKDAVMFLREVIHTFGRNYSLTSQCIEPHAKAFGEKVPELFSPRGRSSKNNATISSTVRLRWRPN